MQSQNRRNPPRLPAKVRVSPGTKPRRKPTHDVTTENIGERLHAFAGEAYSAALKFYVEHYDDPAALAAYIRALKGGKR